jgi:pimeloyl-ACP methyl ester carboxylesterase
VDTVQSGSCPIFFCHAQEDELVPLSEGKALAAVYGNRGECWWVANASHYDVRQRNREEYLRRLRDFLERCLRTSQGEP